MLAVLALLAIGPQSGVVVRPDVKLPYRVVGKGAPVLMLSGGPGFTVDYMEDIANRVGRDQYGWILLEQRGTPRAKLAKPTAKALEMSDYLDDLEALRKQLGLRQWSVVGQSWGSVLAEAYAAAYPDRVRSLALLDTPGPDLEWMSYGGDNINRALTEEDRKATAEASKKYADDPEGLIYWTLITRLPGYVYNRDAAEPLKKLFPPGCVTGSTLPIVFANLQKEKWNIAKELHRYNRPALVVQGRQDFLGEYAAVKAAQALPKAKLVFVERAGHLAWVDNPKPFISALSEFLKAYAR